MPLCKVQQRRVLPVPGEGAAGAPEVHLDLGHRHGRCRRRTRQLDGGRAEGFVVQVGNRHAPLGHGRHQRLHHRRRSAHVELVAAVRQRAPQEVDVHVSLVLEIAAEAVFRVRAAVHDVEPQSRMSGSQGFELGLVRMLAAVAKPIEEMQRALRLMGQAPTQHAHHRRDTDATADQHGGHRGVGVDEEVARGRLHAQNVTHLHLVMKVVRRDSRLELGMIRRRRHPLDRHAIVRGIGTIGQRVAARDRALACGGIG